MVIHPILIRASIVMRTTPKMFGENYKARNGKRKCAGMAGKGLLKETQTLHRILLALVGTCISSAMRRIIPMLPSLARSSATTLGCRVKLRIAAARLLYLSQQAGSSSACVRMRGSSRSLLLSESKSNLSGLISSQCLRRDST